ncbi:thioredoxin family protein [Bacillus halotolerans]|uniref:thioredoxin family protein n=1 Tax=Bacillus halotolerans TaxID=260554 RepID=UPI000D03FEE0|nr:thioredoxin family protein [Bacillus halotolerans]MEC1604583.1 thioredoxin domain-containing protein [Bacillus halotolerans]PRP53407.1 thioredoxin [Bacillus halotolerans]
MTIIKVTDGNLEKNLNTDKVVLLNFSASWCGPCRVFAETLEEFDKEYGDKVQVVKVDVDENPELAEEFGVMSIPNTRFYSNNKFEKPFAGIVGIAQLKEEVSKIKSL